MFVDYLTMDVFVIYLTADVCRLPDCLFFVCRLSGCMLTEESCCYLTSALSSNPAHLRELDLSYNHLGQSGEKKLSDTLNNPNCTLEILKYVWHRW